MDNDLSKCKVGDLIATVKGWVKITSRAMDYYPIYVESKTYTLDGKREDDDKAPSAFVEPPEWLLEYIGPKPCEFKKDELVMVRGHDDLEWVLRYFAYYEGDKYYAYNSGNTSITSRGSASAWKYCRKAIEGEDY